MNEQQYRIAKLSWNAAWRKALADYGDTTNDSVLCGMTTGARDKAFKEWYDDTLTEE